MKKLKWISFVIFCVSLAASLIFWFTQIRKGDRIGPVISMEQQELTVKLDASDEDFLQGVKAVDENDGDVTDSLVVESVSNFLSGGRRLVVYAAVDRHNNVSRASRIVQYVCTFSIVGFGLICEYTSYASPALSKTSVTFFVTPNFTRSGSEQTNAFLNPRFVASVAIS